MKRKIDNEHVNCDDTLLTDVKCKGKDEKAFVRELGKKGFSKINDPTWILLNGTPLHYACSEGRLTLVKFLIKSGANIHAEDDVQRTPLHCACCAYSVDPDGDNQMHFEIVRLLVKSGAKVFVENCKRRTPFYWASHAGQWEIKKLLLENGTYLIKDQYYDVVRAQTLERACLEGYFELAALMIKNGTNVHTRNKDGKTLLHHTSKSGNVKVSKLLIKNGVYVNATDQNGRTPLHETNIYGFCELPSIDLLIANGANINAQDKDGKTLLHDLCDCYPWCGNLEATELVVQYLADPNLQEYKFGKTPFFMACENDALPQAKILFDYGADIDTQASNGDTPLHASIKKGHLDTAKWLIENNADLKIKNNAGRTPVFPVFDDDYYDEILDLLLSRMKKRNRERRKKENTRLKKIV